MLKQVVRFILCVFLANCGIVWSAQGQQRVASREDVTFQNGKICVSGVPLTPANASDYLSEYQALRYIKAYRTEKTGAVLGLTGGGLAVASGIYWGIAAAQFDPQKTDILPAGMTLGPMGVVLGSVVGLSGMVVWLSGRKRVLLLEQQFREAGLSQAELNLSFTPGGIGLALNF